MTVTKTRISATISKELAQLLDEISKKSQHSKSALIEMALKRIFEEKLIKDAEKLTQLEACDLPSEDEWAMIQSSIDD